MGRARVDADPKRPARMLERPMSSRQDRTSRDAAIVEAANAGTSVAALAAQHGLSTSHIYALLKRTGTRLGQGRTDAATRDAAVVDAMTRGDPAPAVATRFGLSRTYVYQVLQRHGVSLRNIQSEEKNGRDETIAEAVRSGASVAAVAAQYGLSKRRIYNLLKAREVGVRPWRPRLRPDDIAMPFVGQGAGIEPGDDATPAGRREASEPVASPEGAVAGDTHFTLLREFEAQRRSVFRAWTEADQLARWLVPRDHQLQFESYELKTSGGYRGRMSDASGPGVWIRGTFRTILPPASLVFTMAREVDGGRVESLGQRIVTLAETGRFTQLKLQMPMSVVLRTRGTIAKEWEERLDRLSAYLETAA